MLLNHKCLNPILTICEVSIFMDEKEVVMYMHEYFRSNGWKARNISQSKEHFEIDIQAEKEGVKYIIQTKGDMPSQESFQIQYAIGQVVAEMRETGPNICYAMALPIRVAEKLWKFGIEGINALQLHLFIVESAYLVWHLNPINVIEYIRIFRERGECPPSTLSTPP